jgi:hypothetical protein
MKIPNLEKINKDFSARLNLSSEANNVFHSLFIQTWPTTSLGFSRIGGDCLTSTKQNSPTSLGGEMNVSLVFLVY